MQKMIVESDTVNMLPMLPAFPPIPQTMPGGAK